MRNTGGFYTLLFLAAMILGGLVLSRGFFILFIVGIPLLLVVGMIPAIRLFRTEGRPLPMPVAPMGESSNLEGRVDRMAIEDVEIPNESSAFWRGPRPASIYIIIISGLQYTLDPTPVLRGGYDWIHEGIWVRATFDRNTRVIYNISPTEDPTR